MDNDNDINKNVEEEKVCASSPSLSKSENRKALSLSYTSCFLTNITKESSVVLDTIQEPECYSNNDILANKKIPTKEPNVMETSDFTKEPSVIKVIEAGVITKEPSFLNEVSLNETDIAINTIPKELSNLSSIHIIAKEPSNTITKEPSNTITKEPSIVREANITAKEPSYINEVFYGRKNILINTNEQCNIREANSSIKETFEIGEGKFNTKVEFFYDRKEVPANSAREQSFYVRETNITKEPLSRKEVFSDKKEVQVSTTIKEPPSIKEAYIRNESLEIKEGNTSTKDPSDIKAEFYSFKEAYHAKEANRSNEELSKMSSNDTIKELYNKEADINKKNSNVLLYNYNIIDMDKSKKESSKISPFITSKETFKTKEVSITTKEPSEDPSYVTPKEPCNTSESLISTKESLKVPIYNTLKESCKSKDNSTIKQYVGMLADYTLKEPYKAKNIHVISKEQFEVENCTIPKEPCISRALTTKKRPSEIPTYTLLKEQYKAKEVNVTTKDSVSTCITPQKTFSTKEAHITKKGPPEVPVYSVSKEPCKILDSTLSNEPYNERFTCIIKKEPIEMSSCTLTSKDSYNAVITNITKKEPCGLSCSAISQELYNVREPMVTKNEPCDYNEVPSGIPTDIPANAKVFNNATKETIYRSKEMEVATINLPDGDIKVFQVAPCVSAREEILDSVGKEICTIMPTFPANKQSLWADVISSIDVRRNPEYFNSPENRSWSGVRTPSTGDIHVGLPIPQHQGMYSALAPYDSSALELSQTCDNDYLKSVKNKVKRASMVKQYRTNPLFREKEKEKDKIRIRRKRADPSFRAVEKEKDRVRRRSARQQQRLVEKEQQFRQIIQALNMQAALFENYGSQSFLPEGENSTGLTDQSNCPSNMITNVPHEFTEQGFSGNADAPVATIDLPDGHVKVFQITPQLMINDQSSNEKTLDGGITTEKNLILPSSSFQNKQSFETAKRWMEILSTMSSRDIMSFMSSVDMRKEAEKFISMDLWSNIIKFGGTDRRWKDLNLCEAQEALVALMPENIVCTYEKDTLAETESRREKDRIRKRMARQDPLYSEQNELRKEKAKARMRERRSNPSYRQAEKERDRLRRKLARQLNTEQRQLERERDKLRRKLSRQLNTEQRQLERERDRVRRRLARQSNPELRRLESERAKERRRLKLLLNPEFRQLERERNTQYKRFARSINNLGPAEKIEVTPMLNLDHSIDTQVPIEEIQVTPMLNLGPDLLNQIHENCS